MHSGAKQTKSSFAIAAAKSTSYEHLLRQRQRNRCRCCHSVKGPLDVKVNELELKLTILSPCNDAFLVFTFCECSYSVRKCVTIRSILMYFLIPSKSKKLYSGCIEAVQKSIRVLLSLFLPSSRIHWG